ncbi:10847_t:CDS:2 [Paraglomus occultum]|uniref:DASH complex subunit SPC19 n=1 Tax=Paraglomus occultum TaxID=144539 RepID=A0A9N8VGD4_9GLOM|nr:10847_t:CDS:2 [Paraglomus occultum]
MSLTRPANYAYYNPQLPPAYIQSLEKCVEKLQNSSLLLQTSVKKLEYDTREFSRLNQVIQCERHYELVTDKDIGEAQKALAAELAPEVSRLIAQVEEELTVLEIKEKKLQYEVDEREAKLESSKLLPSSSLSASKGQPNVHPNSQPAQLKKKLKTLKMKKERLAQFVDNLVEDIARKEAELHQRTRSTVEVPAMSLTQQQIESVEKQMDQLQSQISERRQVLQEKQLSFDRQQEPAEPTPNDDGTLYSGNDRTLSPDKRWKEYEKQLEFFKNNREGAKRVLATQSDLIKDFESACNIYLKAVKKDHAEAASLIQNLNRTRARSLQNTQLLTKALFPIDNLGSTIYRMIQLLLDSDKKELSVKSLITEFPPGQERKHRLHCAISMLNEFSICETLAVCNSENVNGDEKEEIILKITFRDMEG